MGREGRIEVSLRAFSTVTWSVSLGVEHDRRMEGGESIDLVLGRSVGRSVGLFFERSRRRRKKGGGGGGTVT